ncbi:MAG TPA: beta-ketoacyl-[acyl-carrier-protein] synthase II [Candidatus Aminicenantes bacterium]|nr:beta-ketoacyl-[acyl-carrier-protein] synthase II [Candidatus Aminicenantes bacterium]
MKRVVVTGLGAISPLGRTAADSWKRARAGANGVGYISRFDASQYYSRVAGEVKDYDPLEYFDRRDLRKYDPYIQFALIAAEDAYRDSGLAEAKLDPTRCGVYIGSGIGGISNIEKNVIRLLERGPSRVSPFFLPATIANLASGNVSIRYGMKGPNLANVTACATSTHSIGESFRIIQMGDADIMVAGGAEYPITPLGVAGFSIMRALSSRNDAPERASRPFDLERDGFVIAEGAAVVVLESLESALKRNALIYAEVSGYGYTGDAFHMTAPDPEADGAVRTMEMAIRDAGITTSQIDYINAHGTSTPLNDKTESLGIRKLFGEHADHLAISSTKSMTGHMLGATGAMEFVFTTMALKEGFVPPTINLENPDPECDLNYTPGKGVERELTHALTNSFGFGGTNGALVVSRFMAD